MGRDSNSTRKWEKDRRDRLKEAFDQLGKVLPNYNPSQTLVKIEILTKAALHIKDLEDKVKNLVLPDTNKDEIETDFVRNLQERIKKLLTRNEQLCNLLKDANITIPKACGLVKKFRVPLKWSNRINPETAQLLSKNEAEKGTRTRKTPRKKFRQTTSIAPKHKKILRSRFDERKVKPAKRKNIAVVPQKLLIVVSQPTINQQCYIITNPPRNTLVQNNYTSTVNSNTIIFTTSQLTRTNSKVTTLGPGTLILANGSILPVIQNQNFIPTPTIIANNINPRPNIQNVIVVSSVNTPKITPIVTVAQQKGVTSYKPVRPKTCFTQTTQVNKVPIPASRYAHNYVVFDHPPPEVPNNKNNIKKGKSVVKRKIVEQKSEESQTDINIEGNDEIPSKKSKIEIISNEVINQGNALNKDKTSVASTSKNIANEEIQPEVDKVDKISKPNSNTALVKDNKENISDEPNNKPDTKLSIDAEKITQLKEKVDSNELPDLNANELNLQHSELSNDLFASLQVPTGCQNPESTSPTAAFLLTFPLVSTSNGVKVTEVIDEENSERGTPNLLQIGTMTNTRTTVSQSDALTPSLLNLDNFSFFTGKEFANYSNSYTTPSNIFSNSFKSTTPSIISTSIFSNNYTFTFTTASSIVTPSVFTNSTNTDNKKIKRFFDPLPYNINEKIIENPKSAAYSQMPNLLSDNIVPIPSTITLQPSLPPPSMRPKIPSSFDVMQPIIHSTLSMQPKLQNAPPKTSFSLGLQPPINNLPPITTFTTSFPPKLHNTPSSTSFNMHTSQSMQPAIHTLPLTTSASMQPKLHPAPPTTTFNVQSMVPPTTMASMQPKTHVSPPKLRNMQPTLHSQSSSTSFNSFNTFPITTTVSMQLKSHAVTLATSFNSTQPPPTTTVSMQPKIHISTNLFNAPRTSFNVQSIAPPKLLQTAPPNTLFSNVQSLAPPMQSKIHPLPPTSFNVQSIAPPSSQPKLHFNAPPINQSTFSMQPKLHHAPPTTSFNVQSIAPPTSFNLQSIAPPLNTFSMQPKLHNNVLAPPTSFDMHSVAPPTSRSMQPIQHTIHPPTSINMQPGSLPIKAVLDPPQKEIKNYHHHNNKAYANAQMGNESNSARTNCTSYNPKSSNNAVSSYSYYGDSSNFNSNCYKNINKNDNKGYYSMPTYDNYENYKKCDNFSDNYYAATQNPSKDKFNSPPKSKQPSQSKPPINWMTAPDNKIQTDYFLPPLSKENEFTVYPNNSFASNSQTTYFNTNTMYSTSEITMNDNTRKTIDLPINPSLSNNYQRTDLEEWSPAKMPQFLDPLVGDLGLNHIYEPKTDKRVKDTSRRSKNVNYDNQTNFLSVSQLVDSNKNENVPARTTTRRNSGNRAKTQQVKQKRKSQEAKEMPSNANKSDGLKNTQQMNKFVASFNNQDIFCENSNNKPKNSSSNYTAEALIGHTNNIINDANKKQNYTNKTLVPPPFLTDNIITYFPPVEFTQENTYIPQNQAYNSNTFTHNFGTFQNTSYTANNFIPATNTITTTYIPTNNFVHDTHDFISDNFNNIFSTPVKEKPCPKPNRNVNSNTEKNLNQNCTNTYKKGKKKPPHDTNINNFDIQFLSMPGNRNSPLLPDDFHTHTTYIPPPTTYKTINPFSHNNNKTSDMSSTPLLPLPPVPGTRNSNQPEILPVNSSGTSLTNFNLSTIFPEINKGPIPELYSRNKDQGSNRNYNPSTSTAIQAPFVGNKSSFNFNYNNN